MTESVFCSFAEGQKYKYYKQNYILSLKLDRRDNGSYSKF